MRPMLCWSADPDGIPPTGKYSDEYGLLTFGPGHKIFALETLYPQCFPDYCITAFRCTCTHRFHWYAFLPPFSRAVGMGPIIDAFNSTYSTWSEPMDFYKSPRDRHYGSSITIWDQKLSFSAHHYVTELLDEWPEIGDPRPGVVWTYDTPDTDDSDISFQNADAGCNLD